MSNKAGIVLFAYALVNSYALYLTRKAIYDRSGAENGVKAKESGRLAWLLWRSAYFTMTLSVRNKYVKIIMLPDCVLIWNLDVRILVPTYW